MSTLLAKLRADLDTLWEAIRNRCRANPLGMHVLGSVIEDYLTDPEQLRTADPDLLEAVITLAAISIREVALQHKMDEVAKTN